MKLEVKLLMFSYIILILVMFILPFFTTEGYTITKNTTSQLAAQKTPNAWIMNTTFVLMGLISIMAGWSHYDRYWFQKIALLLFGCSLMLTAVFSHAPLDNTLPYNIKADQLHSLFASSTGFGFTLLAVSTGFVKATNYERILPIAIGIAAVVLSVLMFLFDDYKGIFQRLIFLISFGWMILEFDTHLK